MCKRYAQMVLTFRIAYILWLNKPYINFLYYLKVQQHVKSIVVSSYGERQQDRSFCFVPAYKDKTMGTLGQLTSRFTTIKHFAFVCCYNVRCFFFPLNSSVYWMACNLSYLFLHLQISSHKAHSGTIPVLRSTLYVTFDSFLIICVGIQKLPDPNNP